MANVAVGERFEVHRGPGAASGTCGTPAPHSASSRARSGSSWPSRCWRSGWSPTSTAPCASEAPGSTSCSGSSWPATLGNFTDRLRLGYVIDFVSVGIGDTRWPTFNVADSSVVVGIGLLVALPPSPTGPRSARGDRGDGPGGTARSRAGAGGRVDLAVAAVAGISRAHAQRLIGDGRALVDGARRRSSDRLSGGERGHAWSSARRRTRR